MSDISFGWTAPAFVHNMKWVTRRNWNESYAKTFRKGKVVRALSKSFRFGGEIMGSATLIEDPFIQRTGDSDFNQMYVREGFEFLDSEFDRIERPLKIATQRWIDADIPVWVVPFDSVHISDGMKEKYGTREMIAEAVRKLLKELP